MINISERTYMRKNAKKKSNKTNRGLIFEAGATYSTTSDSFNLTITLPYSGQEIVVTQDTDKDSAPTPHSASNWSGEWWNKV